MAIERGPLLSVIRCRHACPVDNMKASEYSIKSILGYAVEVWTFKIALYLLFLGKVFFCVEHGHKVWIWQGLEIWDSKKI